MTGWAAASGFNAPLTRDDRLAVLSFDSHLRIWTDFTNDRERLRTLLARDIIAGRTALERVTRALAGHYVLFLEPPTLRPGVHRIEVRLTSRRGRVLVQHLHVV